MKSKIKKYIVPILLIIVVVPSIYYLLTPGYFPMHDDIQAFRLLELDKCIQDGQIPCRWIPDMGFGYGYPQFNYYGPFPYYLMEIVHLLGFGFLNSVKIGFALSVVVSAFGMYLLGKSLWGRSAGMISAIIYVYAPYRAVNIYVRGAMGEAWGMAFLPFIFWATGEVVKGKKYAELWLALSVFALFTSHNITALIFIPFYALWILFLLLPERVDRKSIYRSISKLFLSLLWGFSMSLFFTLPAFLEKNLVHVETLLMGYFNYLAHYVGLSQLLFSRKFDYGVSELGTNDGMLLSPGILLWAVPLISIALLYLLNKKKYLLQVVFVVLLGWVSLFMIHPRSVSIWRIIPMLSYVQFPWRYLMLASLFFSLAFGSIVLSVPKGKARSIVVFGVLILALVFYGNYFKPKEVFDITDEDKFTGDAWEKQLTISIFDYLPISAEYPPTSVAPEKAEFVNGSGETVSYKKGTDWQDWEIGVTSEKSDVIFPLYYFPNWTAEVNGGASDITHDNVLGLITLKLNEGNNNVKLRLRNTPVRSLSNLITLLSFGLVPVYLYKRNKDNVK